MIIERDKRYFKRYRLRLKARAKFAPSLPLTGKPGDDTILRALIKALGSKSAISIQPNGDAVELIKTSLSAKDSVLTLLFHRSSPTAADPAYRKKSKDGLKLRLPKKERDEEQAVSAHLILSTVAGDPDSYDAVLEEIPGLSLSTISQV